MQEAQSDVAAKLSQSIYWVESILSKCHEEGELLFFTIRTAEQPQVLPGPDIMFARSLVKFVPAVAT